MADLTRAEFVAAIKAVFPKAQDEHINPSATKTVRGVVTEWHAFLAVVYSADWVDVRHENGKWRCGPGPACVSLEEARLAGIATYEEIARRYNEEKNILAIAAEPLKENDT